jgi:hypothetical protein
VAIKCSIEVDAGHVSADNYSPRENHHDLVSGRLDPRARRPRRAVFPADAGGPLVTPLRVAAVGVGMWGKTLTDACARAGNLAVVACTSRSSESRAAFARAHGCRELPDYDAVLADPEIEGVLLTTPHSAHAAQVMAAA